ncbi:MAG TPA: hypothetical protein VF426_00440 [Marmoricola sp.]
MTERSTSIARLPGKYGFALFLRDAGLSDDEIAVRLDLDVGATRNLLALAERKLAGLGPESELG